MTERPVCVVTGGSSGIGRAIAIALAAAGRRLVIVGRNEGRLAEAAEDVKAAGGIDCTALALDVSQPGDMARMAEHCRERYGRIDALIAGAGIVRTVGAASRLPSATVDLPLAEWQGVLDVNLNGVFFSNRAVLPIMIAQGYGEIVNIGSALSPRGLRGRPLAQAYSASKFAVAAFTTALAREVEAEGIRVSAIFPGPVDTPLIEKTAVAAEFGGQIAQRSFAEAAL
ncbi:MAG: SDR family oxidoreductase, partial [Rhodospirillales bacterium]|nr:SDR family oxidoreductase [Rhodospirillales bacterium]